MGISPFTLSWTPGMLTSYSANLVRAGSRAEMGGVGQEVGGCGSGSRGPGGELDGRWLKLNSRVGKERVKKGEIKGA